MPAKIQKQPTLTVYQIRVKGHLAAHWSEWFDEMTITFDADRGETLLEGPVADQAALHGLLNKIRDLSLPLLSLTRVNPDPALTTR